MIFIQGFISAFPKMLSLAQAYNSAGQKAQS